MIVVAYPGAWEEALGISFMHAADKPIRAIYLVADPLRDRTEGDAILLCPTVPFTVAEEVLVALKDQCSYCGSVTHRVVRRDDLQAGLRMYLNDHFKVAIRVSESVFVREYTNYVLVEESGNEIKADRAIVIASAVSWDWRWIVNVPLQLQIENNGKRVSHWQAEPLNPEGDCLNVAPLGNVSLEAGARLEWALTAHNRYTLKVTSSLEVSRSDLLTILQENGWPRVHLKPCRRPGQFTLTSKVLARFTRAALFSFLRKWVIIYLQTWLRVAIAVFLTARTRFLTSYAIFYSLELFAAWFIFRVHTKGLYRTILFFLRLLIRIFERSEARVRSSTQSRFFSFTLILTLVQLLGAEAIKFLWRRVEHWWGGRKIVSAPLIKCRLNSQSDRVNVVLLDTDASFSDVAYSRLVLSYWGGRKE